MVTTIVAIIGCLTGVASLTLSLIRSWNEKFDVRIHFYESGSVFFHKLNLYSSYKTDYQGLIKVRFENRSSTPITVFSIKATAEGKPIAFQKIEWPGGKQDYLDFPIKKNTYTRISIGRELEVPLRIEPYDACEGYLFFPVFPSIESDTAIIKLTAETTKRAVDAVSKVRFIGIRS